MRPRASLPQLTCNLPEGARYATCWRYMLPWLDGSGGCGAPLAGACGVCVHRGASINKERSPVACHVPCGRAQAQCV
jgi:hypothetical protein